MSQVQHNSSRMSFLSAGGRKREENVLVCFIPSLPEAGFASNCSALIFRSPDTCYVLSFAIIMLNTSLHNHNVRDKPTAERFISMNRGINEGGDLPEELLRVSGSANRMNM